MLIRWQEVRHLEERFEGLGGQPVGSRNGAVIKARGATERRLEDIMATVNATLFEQFGQKRIDIEAAATAYKTLLDRLAPDELVVATTNYDRSLEAGLVRAGRSCTTGFRGAPEETPVLDPSGMVKAASIDVPVIHLHGAVGWYFEDGRVHDHRADKPFNSTLGTPVVLYPDPDKEPASTATVDALWREFAYAIDAAQTVFVLGHSLHDPPLVAALNDVAYWKPVAISYYDASDREAVTAAVPRAVPVQVDFGPQPTFDDHALEEFIARAGDGPATPLTAHRRPKARSQRRSA